MSGNDNRPPVPNVLLIDALNLIRRVYGGSPLEDSPDSIEPLVDAVEGSVKRGLKETRPTHAAMVYEGDGPTWRHELFPEFKADRKPMEACVREALPLIQDRLNAHHDLQAVTLPHFEADDVIASLAASLSLRQIPVTILSTDKDYGMILGGTIYQRHHFDRRYRDRAWYQQKFGVPVEQLRGLFAFMGDGQDKGIPGVPGVGAKTAAKWLTEFGSFENLLNRLDALPGKTGQKVRDHLDDLQLSYALVNLKTDVPLSGFNLADFKLHTAS